MRLLLDTHVFLWFLTRNARLPESFRDAILANENEVFLSVVSLWEAMVKCQLGKLILPGPPEVYLPAQRSRHNIAPLDLDEAAVKQLSLLPSLHRDPFDRMLICQTLAYRLVLVTVDDAILKYQVPALSPV